MYGNPKISIIVPVFNVEAFLPRCFNSILSQTYPYFEVLVNNDGSTDNSLRICKEYSEKDSRIKVYTQRNRGVAAARNEMFDKVSGEYFTFIDPDDYIHTTYLETLIGLINSYDADIASCSFYVVNEINGKVKRKKRNKNRTIEFTSRQYVDEMLKSDDFGCYPWGKLYRVEYLKFLHFPEGMIFEDLSAMPAFVLNVKKVVHTEKELYVYTKRVNSQLNSQFSKKRGDRLCAYKAIYDTAYSINDFKLARRAMHLFIYFYYCSLHDAKVNKLDPDGYKKAFNECKKWFIKQCFFNKFIFNDKFTSKPLLPWR